MPNIMLRMQDLKGLTPAVDPRKTTHTNLISARNVYFTADSLVSGFGNTLLCDRKFAETAHTQSIRIGTPSGFISLLFTNTCVYEWSENLGTYVPKYWYSSTATTPYRWSHGYINGILYLCHPAVGLLSYNVTTKQITKSTGTAIPTTPLYITENNGRLIVIDSQYVYYSAQAEGTNFRAASGAGGFALIAARTPGAPIAVESYAAGILVLTSAGIMKGEFTGDAAVYRWRNVTTEYYPVNSFCVIRTTDDTVVFLDKRGLFETSGGQPKPHTPLWNEFLIAETEKHRLTEHENLRLEWDNDHRLLYLSVSESDVQPLYDYAYVLYPPLDKWGVFSEQHWGIFPVSIQFTERRGQFFGFMGTDARVHYWAGQPYKASSGGTAADDYWRPSVQYPSVLNEDSTVWHMTSTMTTSTVATEDEFTLQGFYDSENELVISTLSPLDAYAMIGLFRMTDQQHIDMLSEILDVTVGSHLTTDGQTTVTDFTLVDPCLTGTIAGEPVAVHCWDGAEEDYDFSFGSARYVDYGIEIISSLDGRTVVQQSNMELRYSAQGLQYYSTGGVGLYHLVKVSATTTGQMFSLKTLELDGVLHGVM